MSLLTSTSHGKACPLLLLVTGDQGFPGGASGKEPTCQTQEI